MIRKATKEPVYVENASCPRCGAPLLFTPERGLWCARGRCRGPLVRKPKETR